MCGIVGIIKTNGDSVQREEIKRLTDAIVHRGPDDEGVYVDGGVGLAMRRLSIIDLSSGHQPILSEKGDYVIVFNGEIYNYREVRADLIKLGRVFQTNSDTEVVLNGYREWGPDVLSRLNGMWGLAIYDKRKKEVFLARDRLGKKQIYYAVNGGSLVFGSDMRIPIMFHEDNRKLRVDAIPEYLTYSYVVGADTPLRNVKLLPEAHWAKIGTDDGRMEIRRYWNVGEHDGLPDPSSEDEAAEQAYSLLVDAVRKRLVADVPISVMLSSGLDSSSVAYVLAKELGANLKTFSLGYGDEEFDESNDAGDFARQMDMPWQQLIINGGDVAENFHRYIRHNPSLQSNTAQLVYFFVNRMIHEDGFKVALNGAGGDELFAGYKTYQADKIFNVYRRLPGGMRDFSRRAAGLLPVSLGRVTLDYMLKKFTECPYDSTLYAHAYWRTIFSPGELRSVLSPDVVAEIPSFTKAYDTSYQNMGITKADINSLLRADLKSWLIPMLPWTDNMSMAHSVELRLPYLDYRLVHRAVSMPQRFLFRGWKLKRIMKRYLRGRLPDEVLYRSKRGTHLPLSKWLNNELAEIQDHYLSESSLNKDGLFNMDVVRDIVLDFREGRSDNTFKLWSMIILSAWMEQYNISV